MSIIAIKQFELAAIKRSINEAEKYLTKLKKDIRFFYNASVPGTEEGKRAFVNLNQLRDNQRSIKEEIAKMAKLSKMLKSEIRSSGNKTWLAVRYASEICSKGN